MNLVRGGRTRGVAARAIAAAIALTGLGMATSASAAASNACPGANAIDNFVTAANVGAAFTISGNTTEYTFVSLVNENPVNGVPGLAAYCVYVGTAPDSVTIDPSVVGANDVPWVVSGKGKNFGFVRPQGSKSDIGLDGGTTTMGTATWTGGAPTTQTILLHIDDPAVCSALYGSALTTCFVKPTEVSLLPVCDRGAPDLTNVAYTSIPRDAVDCAPPSYAFEANSISEFGDAVGLVVPAGKTLKSLTVLFNSYGCGDAGKWYTGDCDTTLNLNFQHQIKATIYDASTSLPIADSGYQTFTIPFRPSADHINCGGVDPNGYASGSAWFNTVAGTCEYSAKTLLTFTFPAGITLPANVIWTVAFNTTHYGYSPIGELSSCWGVGGGCGYDSLNVGTKSYTNAPFVGSDLIESEAWRVLSPNPPPPVSFTGFTGYRPLGQINLQ